MNLLDPLPVLDPIVAHEVTDYGWRGLVATGEVIEVRSTNGDKAAMPEDEMLVVSGGRVVGKRLIQERAPKVADYLTHYNHAIELFKTNDCLAARYAFEAAVALAPTVHANFNLALVLLGLGQWREGFALYERERQHFAPPTVCWRDVAACGHRRWRGEDLSDKRLMLVHDAGFGDTIMMLRYVPMLTAMGANVSLVMPSELERFATQIAPRSHGPVDYYCPMLSLLHLLDQTQETIPVGAYLDTDPVLVTRWRARIKSPRKKIGIAWSVGRTVEGDYPRAIPLSMLVGALDGDAELFSIQQQGSAEAEILGVRTHRFESFADCAALISLMDEIVTVDTAAAHIAGAIGHPKVTVLLSHWASWRWVGNPFYPHFRLRRQLEEGNWASALVRL